MLRILLFNSEVAEKLLVVTAGNSPRNFWRVSTQLLTGKYLESIQKSIRERFRKSFQHSEERERDATEKLAAKLASQEVAHNKIGDQR